MGEDRLERISYHIGEIIKVLDLDLKDPNLRDTPKRFAQMYLEIFQGLDQEKEPNITVFPNDDGIDDMVVMNDIVFFSMCAHHLLPFFGRAHVAYIPTDRIVGLSKLPRMVEYYARRPQIQERMTHQIADHFDREIRPQGSMVVVEARHLCMEMRGVEKPGAWTTTSSVRGVFRKDRACREEFLNLVAMKREG